MAEEQIKNIGLNGVQSKGDGDWRIGLCTTDKGEIGIRSLSSYLRRRGHTTDLYFLNKGVDGTEDYSRKELEEIVGTLIERKTKLMGFSHRGISEGRFWSLHNHLRKQEYFRNLPFIVGGPQASANPRRYLENDPNIICVRGEGEKTLVELLQWANGEIPLEKIRGIAYAKKDKEIHFTEMREVIKNLNKLPPADYEQFSPKGKHFKLDDSGLSIVTGNFTEPIGNIYIDLLGLDDPGKPLFYLTRRGCLFHCDYCIFSFYNNHRDFKEYTKVRLKNLDVVVNEITALKKNNPSLNLVIFFDSDFFAERSETELESFSKEFGETIGLPVFVYADPRTITAEKLRSLIVPGRLKVTLNIGFQSGSYRILKEYYNRPTSIDMLVDVASWLSEDFVKTGLLQNAVWYDFIIGHEFEQKEDTLKTIELIEKIPKPAVFHIHNLILYETSYLSSRMGYCISSELKKCEFQAPKQHRSFHDKAGQEACNFYKDILRLMLGPASLDGKYGYLEIPSNKFEEWLHYSEKTPSEQEYLRGVIDASIAELEKHPYFYYGKRDTSSSSIKKARDYLRMRGVWNIAKK